MFGLACHLSISEAYAACPGDSVDHPLLNSEAAVEPKDDLEDHHLLNSKTPHLTSELISVASTKKQFHRGYQK